jgi:beta-mannanase
VVHLAPGESFTFKASALDAATVVWIVKAPDGPSYTTYSGDNTMTMVGISVYSPDSITETPQLLSGAASVFRV